jgi:peptidoglycan/LPS O-acetylase OafA/YrhL
MTWLSGSHVKGMTNFSAKSLVSPGAVRLFLASVVVVHHSLPLRAGSWAVYAFFILSGYWIARMWNTHYCRTKSAYFTFLASRWWRLLPVFLVCTGLGVASAFLLNETAGLANASSPGWWLRQAIIFGSSDAGRILPPTWSLDVEMQFYLIAPILIWAFSKISTVWRWMAVAALLVLLAGQLATGTDPESARFDLFSGFFLAGVALALRKWMPGTKLMLAGLALSLGGTVALLLLPHARDGIWIEGKQSQLGTDPLAAVTASTWWVVPGILVIPFIARSLSARSSAFDRMLGDLAYPLYLFHWIPREWYYHFCEINHAPAVRLVLLVVEFITAFAGAVLILILVDRPMERLRRAWVESRENKLDRIETEKVRIGIGGAS